MPAGSRAAAYAAALERAGADAFVLTSEPAVQHVSGVRLYTQRLIPQRPVACVLLPPAPPVVIACVLEEDQLAAERPGLALDCFREFGDDPWARVAFRLGSAQRVVVEDGMPAAWLEALRARLPAVEVVISYELPLEPRIVKDSVEQELLARASRVAEAALAAGAALAEPGRTEHEVATAIQAAFEARIADTSEVRGTCIGPQNNRAMHHLPADDLLPERGPVRLGIVGRVNGYWVLITRMLMLGDDPVLETAYGRYVAAYEEGLAALVRGASPRELYERCRKRVALGGFELTTLKIGHGTGLDFRERPWLSPFDDLPLAPGMVLAYDYGLDAEDGTVLHLEDRVLVTEAGPRRLSGRWDLADLHAGFHAAL
jgi:Xaa-Pro aminopeptidase